MGTFRDLVVYQKAYQLAMDIHLITRSFPEDEKFGIVSQIRRSSKSVCANFVESYRRRDYKKHFVSKLSDCLSENSETGLWLEFSNDLKYIEPAAFNDFRSRNDEIGKLLSFMIQQPQKFVWTNI